MEGVKTPGNWESMNFGEKLIWLYEKQKEIEDELERSHLALSQRKAKIASC